MSKRDTEQDERQSERRRGLTPWQVAKSTLAAALGVQTPEARERDFTEGSPLPFIVAGIVFTVVFIVVLVIVVQLVLASAGS